MKKTILSAMTALSGLSLCAVGFDGLTLRTNDWFDASFVGSTTEITAGPATCISPGAGTWASVPDGVSNTESAYLSLAIDSGSEQLTFIPAPFSVTSGYETVVANIKPEVTDGDLITITDVQAAFCIQVDGSTLKAMGYTLSGWKDISYTAASTAYSVESLTNYWFTLYMDFAKDKDNSTRYVRYSVKPDNGTLAVLTDSTGASWFQTVNKETIESISFTGSGKVKTFSGDELTEPLTFIDPVFTYMANYESATTVVATVTGAVASDTTFTLTVGNANYTGTYNSAKEKVTFYDVKNLNLGETVSYTISAAGAATEGSSGAQTTVVGNVSGGWILEDIGHNGSGTWTDSSGAVPTLDYSSGSAALSDYLFTPTNSVGDAVVTVISQVCFGDVADTSVNPGNDSYAAFRIGDDSGTPTFQVWVKVSEESESPDWVNVSGVTPNTETAYTLTSKFDFIEGTCEFFIDGTQLVNGQTFKFYLANNIRKMSSIKFNGTGSLVSLNGSYVKGEKYTAGDTGIVVPSSWVASYLGTNTVDDAKTILTNNAVKTTHGSTSYNYFECYALGIDPANSEEAPVVSAAPGTDGIKMSLAGISVPEGVTLNVQLQKSADGKIYSNVGEPADVVGTAEGTKSSGNITINASDIPDGVMRYKMDISIGATAP